MTDARVESFEDLWRIYAADTIVNDVRRDYLGQPKQILVRDSQREGYTSSLLKFLHLCGILETGLEAQTLRIPQRAAEELLDILSNDAVQRTSLHFSMRLPGKLQERILKQYTSSRRRRSDDWFRRLVALDLTLHDSEIGEFLHVAGVYGTQGLRQLRFIDQFGDPERLSASMLTPRRNRSADQQAILGLESFIFFAAHMDSLAEKAPTARLQGKVFDLYAFILQRRGYEISALIDRSLGAIAKFNLELSTIDVAEKTYLEDAVKKANYHYHTNSGDMYVVDIKTFLKEQIEPWTTMATLDGRQSAFRKAFVPLHMVDGSGHQVTYASLRQRVTRGHRAAAYLVGYGGSGKTWMLQRLAYDLSLQSLKQQSYISYVPIVFPIRQFSPGRSLFAAISAFTGLDDAALSHAFSRYHVILCVDGLDEVSEDIRRELHDEMRSLEDTFEDFGVIYSSRSTPDLSEINDEQRVTIVGIEKDLVIDNITKNNRDRDDLQAYAHNRRENYFLPLEISLLLSVSQATGRVDHPRGRLIQLFIKMSVERSLHFRKSDAGSLRGDTIRALEEFSFYLFERNEFDLPTDEALEAVKEIQERWQSGTHSTACFNLIIDSGLFVNDEDQNKIRPLHRSFVDNLAARSVINRFRDKKEIVEFLSFKTLPYRAQDLLFAILDCWEEPELNSFVNVLINAKYRDSDIYESLVEATQKYLQERNALQSRSAG